MKPVAKFLVIPRLPAALEKLRAVAYNLRWSWNHETIDLFRRLDNDLWEACNHNPVCMLGRIDQRKLETAAADDAFLAQLGRVSADLEEYLTERANWFRRTHGGKDLQVGYFSAEFGITESLSIFAGGLGILSGDHLKSSSDLGVPLVGVGLLYQQGYFLQHLNASGWQQEDYVDNDFSNLPLSLVKGANGEPLLISVRMAGRDVKAQVWSAQVGRIPLYLLDTNISANGEYERNITDQLYGGDKQTRLRQELLLGIGGYRALEVLGLEPTVFHMNEGHSAFLSLEHVRRLMGRHGLTFQEARELASSSLVFTTHTPVEAGHDYFPAELMRSYFYEYASELGLNWTQFMGLGHQTPTHDGEDFCMTVLALKLASTTNAVSKLHGEVTRRMWSAMWPGGRLEEVPIGHVTNGVHFQSWISRDMNELLERYLGPRWREEPADESIWERVDGIPAEELWRTHERRRERLVAFARSRLAEQLSRRGVPQADLQSAEDVLDSRTLTIGFARRFAAYKRATLLFQDADRLARILNNPERPVQIIMAGKAHPQDQGGKELIHHIAGLARRPEFRLRLVFLEDYDMAVARYMLQGVDIWLNTPLRPNEACGTSGMKAAANGVINVSTLDGWWDEAWRLAREEGVFSGWAIGRGEVYSDREDQDRLDAEALYELLVRDVVPTFYDRAAGGLPRRWIALMKSELTSLCHVYNSHRMVREYTERLYLPSHVRRARFAESDAARARTLSAWKSRVSAAWKDVGVLKVENGVPGQIQVGDMVRVRAEIALGPLSPDDVAVELCLGRLTADGEINSSAEVTAMRPVGGQDGHVVYETEYGPCTLSGSVGYTVRVIPSHPDLGGRRLPGCVHYAQSAAVGI